MRIVVLDGYTENPGDLSWGGLEAFGQVTVYDRTSYTDAPIIAERIGDAEIAVINKTPITAKTLDACPQLKLIAVLATGYNVVDCAAARERGVSVVNVPTYGTQIVGQFAVGLLMEICSHIGHHSETVKAGKWQNGVDFCYWDKAPILLDGMTFGVIGTGRIGCRTAKIAQALGMRVIGYSRSENAAFCGERLSFSEVLSQSDVLSLHCPATADTVGMIRRETIGQMKDGAILINTARGSLVNESDVAEALRSGKLSAFAADVVSTEPIAKSNPLLDAPNCFLTSHYAWSPVPTRQKLIDVSAANLAAFLNGSPIHVVS